MPPLGWQSPGIVAHRVIEMHHPERSNDRVRPNDEPRPEGTASPGGTARSRHHADSCQLIAKQPTVEMTSSSYFTLISICREVSVLSYCTYPLKVL